MTWATYCWNTLTCGSLGDVTTFSNKVESCSSSWSEMTRWSKLFEAYWVNKFNQFCLVSSFLGGDFGSTSDMCADYIYYKARTTSSVCLPVSSSEARVCASLSTSTTEDSCFDSIIDYSSMDIFWVLGSRAVDYSLSRVNRSTSSGIPWSRVA